MRLDIGWLDLLAAAVFSLYPLPRLPFYRQACRLWNSQGNALVTLSVRSGFDLMLRAVHLPRGSEVLLTAVTVPDMVKIIHAHGLVPIPVDIDESGRVCIDSLRNCLGPRARILVVAHLFGNRVPLDEVVDAIKPYNLLLVEDCAQAFSSVGEIGHPKSDVVMHSFGPIKTATALGGAVVRVACPQLLKRMARILMNDPVQSRISFDLRVLRFALLKLLSGRLTARVLFRGLERGGFDADTIINTLARGFTNSELLKQIRRQPCSPLLRLLVRRWTHYDFSRISRRTLLGQRLDDKTGIKHFDNHSYWVNPVFVRDAVLIRDRLRAAGFDATCLSRMVVVPNPDDRPIPIHARQMYNNILFLPWYPEITDEAVDQMADVLLSPAN